MKSNADIVREACQIIWTKGQIDRVPDFYSYDFTADYAFTDWGTGIEGVKALASSVRVGLPDYREEIKLLIDGGEYIVVELLIEGTHTGPMNGMDPTGKSVAFRDVTIAGCQITSLCSSSSVLSQSWADPNSLATTDQDMADQTSPSVSSPFRD